MRTTLTLDDDVYEAAETLARASGKRLGQVVSDLIRRGLRPPPVAARSRARFPTFEIPPDAPVISAGRIQRILDDEGAV
jgi:hypothetical protein